MERLPDAWTVFHSVVWQGPRGARQADGEADFILLHPEHGLIILEVKGGRIDIQDGTWFSVDRADKRHEIKNPFEQAKDSKYALIRYLENQRPALTRIPICHGVVLPDVTVLGNIGMYGPRDLIIDGADLSATEASITRLLNHWKQSAALSVAQVTTLTRSLAPTHAVRSRLRDVLARSSDQILELTERQYDALRFTKRQRRCSIEGGAGTGKTLLAVERARRLAETGQDVLLTCYNAPLAERIKLEVPEVEVATFHSLCRKQAQRVGLSFPTQPSDEWWETGAADLLANSAGHPSTQHFDAVIVDEGQDFAEDWFTALMLLLRNPEDDPFHIFFDHHQQVHRTGFRLPNGWPPPFTLDRNCRNTIHIARTVSRIFGDDEPTDGAEGEPTVFRECHVLADGIPTIQQLVARLIEDEGLLPNQLVVLSDEPDFCRRLRDKLAGDHSFVELGKTGVVVETVRRFKGLEADAILLALTDGILGDETLRNSLAYVGMSRARCLLTLISSMKVKKSLKWV